MLVNIRFHIDLISTRWVNLLMPLMKNRITRVAENSVVNKYLKFKTIKYTTETVSYHNCIVFTQLKTFLHE